MDKHTKIVISTDEIGVDGLQVEGLLDSACLDIGNDPRFSTEKDIEYTLLLQMLDGGLLISGTAFIALNCVCDNCLVTVEKKIHLEEIYQLIEAPIPREVDLTELIREDIVMGFPFKISCDDSDNCENYLALVETEDKKPVPEKNPWTELDNLKL
ncbi:MAG: hypothetical protein HRT89_20665 [Lentisphaeria bacterium]|nr:hypothetical protein [Lentisphaeria bacterium]NQZ70473.1 hypothetical protein [Lentisphaeria bacterium]